MEKSTFWGILGIMFMGTLLSFLTTAIVEIKYQQDKTSLIESKSTLTDANYLSWGATPGYRNVTQYNTFKFFNHKEGQMFTENKEEFKYSYNSELSNRTYVPSSPGYIKFLPAFSFEKINTQVGDVTNVNIAALQYFYKSFHQPQYTKLTRYLTMVFKGLSEDFMNYYFTHTIFEFYTYDKQSVYDTIFTPAKITTETQDKLWTDDQYGWQSETTFNKWIRAYFNGGDQQLQQYFLLSDDQMNSLIGKGSTINKLRKVIINSVSNGVQGMQKGNCADKNECTIWELGLIQWGFGGLTAKDFVPPIEFGGGSYQTFNDSIPNNYEFYLSGNEFQYDDIKTIISQTFEDDPNLIGFNTMQYIWENNEYPQRVGNKLGWTSGESGQQKAQHIIEYLKLQHQYINNIYDTYAFQTWRFMSKMINEASIMLRDGLHAKALFYQFKGMNCEDEYLIPFSDGCGGEYDFTLNAKYALVWVNAALGNSQSDSFKQLKNAFNSDDETLEEFLYVGTSKFSKVLNQIKQSISTFYKCSYTQCQAQELWYKQWSSSYVTQNYPKDLNFFNEDKVISISQWDIYSDRTPVTYEFYAYSKITLTQSVMQQLFSFDMGGIYGYYSLRNLFEHHFNSSVEINNKFPVKDDTLLSLTNYIKDCLLKYWYGGHFITTDAANYLFDYDNSYTNNMIYFEPVYEGSDWRDNGAYLIQKNSEEYIKFATMYDFYQMDTGIKNIKNVGQVTKTLDEFNIKQKLIIYNNDKTDYITYGYRYPYGEQSKVSGSYGYAFQPNLISDFTQHLELFDFDLYQIIPLKYKKESTHHGYNTYEYQIESQIINLENYRDMPLFITVGSPNLKDCASIDDLTCNQYLDKIEHSYYQIESLTGTVVQFKKIYVYWIKLDNTNPLRQGELYMEQYIPIAIRTIEYEYNEDQMTENFEDVQKLKSDKNLILILSIVFGVLFFIGFIGTIVYYKKNEQNIQSRAASVYSQIDYA